MKRSCVAISWDARESVYGVRAEKDGKSRRITVIGAAAEYSEGDFTARLKKVYDQLVTGEHDYVIMGGTTTGELVFDLKMPRLAPSAVPAALTYELPCLLPKSSDDFCRSFRVVNRGSAVATENIIRIDLMPVKEWERLLSNLDAAGIQADGVINPFMAADPLLADKDIFWPALDEEYLFSRPQRDGLRQMVTVEQEKQPEAIKADELAELSEAAQSIQNDENYIPALLLARYALDGHLTADRKGLLPLPGQLQPQRCVMWRRLAVAMGIVTFLLLGLLLGRSWHDARNRYEKIVAAQERVNGLLTKQQKLIMKNLATEKMLQKIAETKPGSTEVPVILAHLTRKLPEKMWVTNFRSKDQSIDLTITTSEDNDNILTLLSENGVFVAKNLRKQRSYDGSTTLQLFLETAAEGKK